jgi:hypothetical protein
MHKQLADDVNPRFMLDSHSNANRLHSVFIYN